MIRTVSSAPGKLMVCGEYAVLHGARSIATAIDRRVVVTTEPAGSDAWSLVTRGFRDGERHWRPVGDGVEWLDCDASGMRLFEAVMSTATTAGWRADAPVAVTIDSSAFRDEATGRKLGLGSSAATAVALAAAFVRDRKAAYQVAMAAHRTFQEGRGSGFDVATCHHGGVIGYTLDTLPTALAWPSGLHAVFYWSGESAATSEHIKRAERAAAGAELDALCAAAAEVADTWARGRAAAVIEQMRRYTAVLRRYDDRGHLGIFAGGHRRLADHAAGRDDIVYKPCGAGGGDIGMAMALEPEVLGAFTHDAVASGSVMLDLKLDPQGVRTEDPDS